MKEKTFDDLFWAYNYPVQVYTDKLTGTFSFTGYMPRKNTCFESDQYGMEHLDELIDGSIEKLETAISLFKQLKAREIENIYYWDKD